MSWLLTSNQNEEISYIFKYKLYFYYEKAQIFVGLKYLLTLLSDEIFQQWQKFGRPTEIWVDLFFGISVCNLQSMKSLVDRTK